MILSEKIRIALLSEEDGHICLPVEVLEDWHEDADRNEIQIGVMALVCKHGKVTLKQAFQAAKESN